MNSYTHTGATNILFTNERNTKVIGIRGISSNNSSSSIYEGDIYIPSSPEYTKIVQKSCFSAHSARRAKSLCDFAKGFGPGECFPVTCIDHQQSSNFSQTRSLNSRSANSHLRDDAFFGTWRGPSTNFVRDSSPGGVRLSGGNRTFVDVTRSVRCPSRGEDLGKIRKRRYQHSSRVI